MKTRGLSILHVVITAFFPALCSFAQSSSPSLVEDLAIEVKGASREFSFTNKETAFLYGETHSSNRTSWQGFNVFGHEFLDDYEVLVDERKLDRGSARTVVYPDYLKRIYPGGIVEEVRVADSLALFSVTITSRTPVHVDVIPLFADARSEEEYEMKLTTETAALARTNHPARTDKENYPVWLVVQGKGFLPQRKTTRSGMRFSPVMLLAERAKAHTVVFSVGDDLDAATSSAMEYVRNRQRYDKSRRDRMENLLRETYVETSDKRFNKALAWAKLSLDALIMNQVTRGIFAGLPWFNNYWGRDTFISLPGATLVQGRFTEAKQILQSFAEFQQLDSTSSDYGRIPNIITTTDTAYNTADGTPRFVIMAKEYVERSGDTSFMYSIYPTILRSIEGTLIYHCDSLGFLTHGDAETWMDAVGPDGPWSPRGNRGNDIQALWAQQLEAGIWFATRIGDPVSARRWSDQLELLKRNFQAFFFIKGIVTDHLTRDGKPDTHLRPNQIFTSPLLTEEERTGVLQIVFDSLTYPYGVASLSQRDGNFHPYHQYEPYYPKDAAYHNGTVWTWLQGKLISELCQFNKQNLAFRITENSVHQILDRGAVGTQSELLDAIPRAGEKEPRLSGTFSQAWNLAEFIRNFYDDFLGVNVSLLHHHLVLRPHLPESLGSIKATINLNGRALPIQVDRGRDSTIVLINGQILRKGGPATIEFQNDTIRQQTQLRIPPNSRTKYRLSGNNVSVVINGVTQVELNTISSHVKVFSRLDSLTFVIPALMNDLKALKGPDFPLIQNMQIKATNPAAKVLLDANDPRGDDNGSGAYSYPKNPAFVPGAFDIMHFRVSYDSRNAYFTLSFRALSNPGWHPEYGFQLTYVAIAIDEDGRNGSGRRPVGHNANYLLAEDNAYERLILVGGGVRVEDSSGKVLAAYVPVPADTAAPLGDATNGTMSFAVPLTYLGEPQSRWTFTVLAGAQDDHGGAGLGEFRTVNSEAGEWNGGGKMNPGDPNVYDVLKASAR